MRLYLMRHGRPVAKEENPEQPLSAQGKKEVEKVANFLNECGVRFEEALHSGKLRARETAQIMLSKLNPGLVLEQRAGLSPLDDVNDIAEYVRTAGDPLLIVGHLPHLGKLTSLLVTGSDSFPVVTFQPGSVVCVERDGRDLWSIIWMLVPEIL